MRRGVILFSKQNRLSRLLDGSFFERHQRVAVLVILPDGRVRFKKIIPPVDDVTAGRSVGGVKIGGGAAGGRRRAVARTAEQAEVAITFTQQGRPAICPDA